jgi:Uma2 family endonuclease
MATADKLMTAEEFFQQGLECAELVRGEVVAMSPAGERHGLVCARIAFRLMSFLGDSPIGKVVTNDTGLLIERSPDTVRGADVAFVRFDRSPDRSGSVGFMRVPPNLVFEVVSPGDRWGEVLAKVAEYLKAGVEVVCVVDPEARSVHVHEQTRPANIVTGDDLVSFPEILPGFCEPVSRFFE